MAKSKILALSFTALVIGLLIMSGPVEGFTLNLSVNKEKPRQGETVTFTAEINIEQTERLPVDKLILELTGRDKIVCTFDKTGQPLDGCDNVKITKISDPGYGYGYNYNFGDGYGFAPGVLKYKVEINTKKIKSGVYTSLFRVKINDQFYTQEGKTLTIKDDNKNEGVCPKEWSCSPWSSCSAGMQYRDCYRNLNACEIEEMPEQERLCLLENGDNFFEEEASIKELGNNTIASETRESVFFSDSGFSQGIRFVIILLLMNCIITTIDIIVRVQQNFILLSRRMRKRTQMPSIKKAK
jgi:hypothetical protein